MISQTKRDRAVKAEKNADRAAERYEDLVFEILDICDGLANDFRDHHKPPMSDGINWGDVGTAAEIAKRLRAAREFIRNEEE